MVLCACAKRENDVAVLAVDKFDDLERRGIHRLLHVELQGDESRDEPARDAEMGGGIAVDHEVGRSRADGVQVGGCGHDVDGAPRGDDGLPAERKVVEVVPQLGYSSSESPGVRCWSCVNTTCEIARSLRVLPVTVPFQEKPDVVPVTLA